MTTPLPLEGVRVLELGHIIAGPSAGLLLADLGADVIKVERPGDGDQSRNMPAGTSANFHFLNRNKRSIAIDLKGSSEGRALFLRLVAGSDVVIDNFAYGAVESLGLGYDVLARVHPGIIYLALKGFLPGPSEARPFLDELAQMSAGLAFMTGPRGQPLRAGASIVDVGAATGQPSVPMPEIRQGTRMGWGVYQLFSAADGEQIFIGITSNGHWERFCDEFGLKDLLADERLDDNAKRVAARDWLPARIAEEMLRYPSPELSERLERARVPFAPLRRPDQLLDDAHLIASGPLLDTPLPGGATAQMVAGIKRVPDVAYEAIWLNEAGLERAARLRESLALRPMFGVAATDTFTRKNTNRSVDEKIAELPGWARRYQALGMDWIDVGVMAAFGCNYEGDVASAQVINVVEKVEEQAVGCGSRLGNISLADTMGWANPLQIKRLVGAVRARWPEIPVKLHLHDTRALAIANVVAALEMGVDRFDSAVAGLGGCPFAAHKGAAGNITTEDLVFLCQELGVDTGIDLDAMIEAGQLAERVVGHPLPGKLKSGGNLTKYRARAAASAASA